MMKGTATSRSRTASPSGSKPGILMGAKAGITNNITCNFAHSRGTNPGISKK